jgi:hypothetical protein
VNYSFVVLAGAVMLLSPTDVRAQDVCALLAPADMAAVLGPGSKTTTIGNEECRFENDLGEYEIHVKRGNAAADFKEWQQFSMAQPAPVKDLGDEASVSSNGNVVIVRKGGAALRVSASGITKKAPLPFKEGVMELAKRIAAKLK